MEEIYRAVKGEFAAAIDGSRAAPTGTDGAGSKEGIYQRSFLRQKLGQLLRSYADQHPWEPMHKLDVICGVNRRRGCMYGPWYHVNFLASAISDDAAAAAASPSSRPVLTLFFAEVWASEPGGGMDGTTSILLLLSAHYTTHHPHLGRCSTCEYRTEMDQIVHPAGKHTGTEYEAGLRYVVEDISPRDKKVQVDGVRESDLIYFDRRRDADVAETLNRGACALPKLNEISVISDY